MEITGSWINRVQDAMECNDAKTKQLIDDMVSTIFDMKETLKDYREYRGYYVKTYGADEVDRDVKDMLTILQETSVKLDTLLSEVLGD